MASREQGDCIFGKNPFARTISRLPDENEGTEKFLLLTKLIELLAINTEEFELLVKEAEGNDIVQHIHCVAKATLSLLDSGLMVDEELSSRRQTLQFLYQ